jgi:hypothetical protein
VSRQQSLAFGCGGGPVEKLVFDAISGLFLFPDYFPSTQCAKVVRETLTLYSRLERAATGTAKVEQAHIPQPELVRSARHNLASEEFFTRVVLVEADQRQLRCEYFPRYGEDGHALAYLRGNANLPDFIGGPLLASIRRTMEEAGLLQPDQELTWKLTVNFYRNIGGIVAGFPFHVDIPANGVVTMILNVQREALFQIAKGDVLTDIQLPVGALLVLSGESRYEWKHRVLPMTGGAGSLGEVERVSLVLGFQ